MVVSESHGRGKGSNQMGEGVSNKILRGTNVSTDGVEKQAEERGQRGVIISSGWANRRERRVRCCMVGTC